MSECDHTIGLASGDKYSRADCYLVNLSDDDGDYIVERFTFCPDCGERLLMPTTPNK